MKPRPNDGERDDADLALPLRLPHNLGHLRSNKILFVEVAYFPDAFIDSPLTSNTDSKVTGFAEKT
jgi:hypothetical protein